jgi:hypothetical protein
VSAKDYGMLQNYLVPNNPLVPEDQEYLRFKEDLVHAKMKNSMAKHPGSVSKIFSSLIAGHPKSWLAVGSTHFMSIK